MADSSCHGVKQPPAFERLEVDTMADISSLRARDNNTGE
jgi:hypothetical protein